MPFSLKNSLRRIADTLKSLFLACALLVAIDGRAQVSVENASEQSVARVPMRGVGIFGGTLLLHTEVFKPMGVGPYPVWSIRMAAQEHKKSAMLW